MIKYQYAYNSDGHMVHIDSVVREAGKRTGKFKCISCDTELIPRLGKVRQRHFTHKETITCSGETYLHNLGKRLFYEQYNLCLANKKPFFIELNQKRICNKREAELNVICHLGKVLTKFDLTQFFPDIKLEKREGAFIPDVMLISKSGKDKLFIEIAVTHFSSEQKLSSNYRIIELEVEDEKDLEVIKQHSLSVRHSRLKFKNFNIKEIKGNLCEHECEKSFNLFVVASDGRSILFQKSLSQISSYLKNEKDRVAFHHISKDTDSGYPNIFKCSVAKAHQDKVKVKNCFLCRYHADNNSWDMLDELESGNKPIFCKFLKLKCNSNQAAKCEYYKPDKKFIDELLESSDFILGRTNANEPDEDYDYEHWATADDTDEV